MKRARLFVTAISLFVIYVGSYAWFYAGRVPAGNLRYFVYLKGGVESERAESILYYVYWPIYKAHRCVGGWEHNLDRPEMVFPKDFKG